jgi:hypothetical protein
VAAACLVATTPFAAKKPYKISGAERVSKTTWAPVETLKGSMQGVTFTIRYLEPAAASKAVGSAVGRDLKLLRPRTPDIDPGHLAFVLQIDNATRQQVRFNPSEAWLYTDKGDTKVALDYSALFMLGNRLDPTIAPSTDEVASAFFDREVLIEPSGSVRKILAFDAPSEDKFRTFEIRIVEVSVGSEPVGFSFPFRKFYED